MFVLNFYQHCTMVSRFLAYKETYLEGLQKRRLTAELLSLSLTERWRLALDESKVIGVVLIEFQKAFDCLNHTVLMDKLHSIGISGSFYDWLLNYLENRKQFVIVNGSNSELLEIDTGVPQGSLLGPRFYFVIGLSR